MCWCSDGAAWNYAVFQAVVGAACVAVGGGGRQLVGVLRCALHARCCGGCCGWRMVHEAHTLAMCVSAGLGGRLRGVMWEVYMVAVLALCFAFRLGVAHVPKLTRLLWKAVTLPMCFHSWRLRVCVAVLGCFASFAGISSNSMQTGLLQQQELWQLACCQTAPAQRYMMPSPVGICKTTAACFAWTGMVFSL